MYPPRHIRGTRLYRRTRSTKLERTRTKGVPPSRSAVRNFALVSFRQLCPGCSLVLPSSALSSSATWQFPAKFATNKPRHASSCLTLFSGHHRSRHEDQSSGTCAAPLMNFLFHAFCLLVEPLDIALMCHVPTVSLAECPCHPDMRPRQSHARRPRKRWKPVRLLPHLHMSCSVASEDQPRVLGHHSSLGQGFPSGLSHTKAMRSCFAHVAFCLSTLQTPGTGGIPRSCSCRAQSLNLSFSIRTGEVFFLRCVADDPTRSRAGDVPCHRRGSPLQGFSPPQLATS